MHLGPWSFWEINLLMLKCSSVPDYSPMGTGFNPHTRWPLLGSPGTTSRSGINHGRERIWPLYIIMPLAQDVGCAACPSATLTCVSHLGLVLEEVSMIFSLVLCVIVLEELQYWKWTRVGQLCLLKTKISRLDECRSNVE